MNARAAAAALPDDPVVPSPTARLTGHGLGIDIGGTGIKAAVVDLATGELVTERIREKTPSPSTPEAVVDVVADICHRLEAMGALTPDLPGGAGFPAVIKAGRPMTASNVDEGWIGAPAQQLLSQRLGRPIEVLNDADAAGVAEISHGAGKGKAGTVLLLTIGTGIGSALFVDGLLVPNLELGHLEFHGKDAEHRLSGAARERRKLGWKRWGREFDAYLKAMERWFWPDLIILGGGVSKSLDKYEKYLSTRAPLVPAAMLNTAGIVGAAMAGANAARAARATTVPPATGSRSSRPSTARPPAAGRRSAGPRSAGSRSTGH
ncbi:MAG TPA: ROK family protein [Candidatus Limnocylindrales bacterium]|nr:ROK family protein [Candidatus Limnocylindrales bacterium]